MSDEPETPPPAMQTVILLDYVVIDGETRPQGKVVTIPTDAAAALIAAGQARVASEFDLRVAGIG